MLGERGKSLIMPIGPHFGDKAQAACTTTAIATFESNNSMARNLMRERGTVGFLHQIIFNRKKSPVVKKLGS